MATLEVNKRGKVFSKCQSTDYSLRGDALAKYNGIEFFVNSDRRARSSATRPWKTTCTAQSRTRTILPRVSNVHAGAADVAHPQPQHASPLLPEKRSSDSGEQGGTPSAFAP